jgi:PAS domain S-box-containing protein
LFYCTVRNITEQYHRDEANRETDLRYRAFIHNSTEGIWCFGLRKPIDILLPVKEQIALMFRDGYLMECNDIYASMYGFSSANEIVGIKLRDVMKRTDPKNLDYLTAFIRSGYRLKDTESNEQDKEGRTFTVANNLVGTVSNGMLINAWGTQRDITEQKRLEAELRQSKDSFEELVHRIPFVVYKWRKKANGQRQIEYVSPQVKNLCGISAEDLLRNQELFVSMIHPEDRQVFLDRSVEDTPFPLPFSCECRAALAGKERWLQFNSTPRTLENGDILWDGILQDVTERVQAQRAVSRSEEKYRSLVNNLYEGIWVIDANAVTTMVNPRMAAIAGVPQESMIGRPLFDFIDKKDFERTERSLARRREGLRDSRDYTFVRKDGSRVFTTVETYPLLNEAGEYAGAVAAFTDITEQHLSEEKIRKQSEENRFLAESSSALVACTSEAEVFSVIKTRLLSLMPGSVVFIMNTSPDGSESTLSDIGGINPSILSAAAKLLRYNPLGRTFKTKKGFAELYCTPTLHFFGGGLHELSMGVVPKFIARQIERMVNTTAVYSIGIAQGETIFGYVHLFTPAPLGVAPASIESFIHQCYLALTKITAQSRVLGEATRRTTLMDITNDGIAIIDQDHKVLECNGSFAAMLGYTVEETAQLHVWDWDCNITESYIRKNFGKIPGMNKRFETRHRRKDGTVYDAEVSVSSTLIDNRLVVVSLCRDISERKRSEAALKNIARDLTTVVENFDGGIMMETGDRKIEFVNHHFCRMFGITAPPETLIGMDCRTASEQAKILLKDPDAFVRRIEELVERKVMSSSETMEMSDGRFLERDFIPILSSGIYDGQLWIYRDVTDRKRNEAEQKHQEEKIRHIFESMEEGVALNELVYDSTGAIIDYRIIDVNPAFERIVGMPREQVMGRLASDLYRMPSEYTAAFWKEHINDTEAIKTDLYNEQLKSWKHISTSIPVNGKFVTSFFDVTELKTAEAELRTSNARLQSLIHSQTNFVVRTDMTGNYTFVNDQFCSSFGYVREQLIGTPSQNTFLPEDFAVVDQTVIRCIQEPGRAFPVVIRKQHPLYGIAVTEWEFIALTDTDEIPTEIQCVGHDITEKYRAVQALQSSEERYRSIVETLRQAYYEADARGLFIYCNPGLLIISGFSPAELLGTSSFRMVASVDRFAVKTAYKRWIRERRKDMSMEFRVTTKHGMTFWVEQSTHFDFDEFGTLVKATNIVKDISERKAAEESLRESEQRYRQITEAITDYIYTVSVSGSVVSATKHGPGCTAVTGYTPEEFDQNRFLWHNMIVPDDRTMVQERIRMLLEHKNAPPVEHRIIRKDGMVRWVRNTLVPRFSETGTLVSYEGLIQDITERKSAEEKLKSSEERSRAIISSLPDILFIHDLEGRFLDYHAPEGVPLWVPPEQFLGKRFVEVLPPAISEIVVPAFTDAVHTGLIQRFEYSAGAGSKQTFFEGRMLMFDDNRVLNIVRDITDRVRAEQALRILNDELESRVLQRTAQLTQANQELEAFSYSVSHDLRAPLRAIDSFSAIMMEGYGDLLDDEGKRLVSIVRSSIRKMDGLINGLLTLSRIGRNELHYSLINMDSLVRSLLQENMDDEGRDRYTVTIGDLPYCVADETLIRQALDNLISNAVKYSSSREHPVIGITGTTDGASVTYTVRDNGVGFDPANANKLFGIFHRLHTDDQFKGLGIGLSIVQRIIHRQGGTVRAEGVLEGGAVFSFTLPVTEVLPPTDESTL